MHSFTQRKVLRLIVPLLLWTEAWPSWNQTCFYGGTNKLWENFPWEVTGFSTSCHSWEVSYANVCWKTCSEQTRVPGLTCGTREQVSMSHGQTGTADVLLSKPTNEKRTACLLPLCRCNSFKSWWWLQCDGQVRLGFMFILSWGNCRCLSAITKESNVSIRTQNKSQEDFSEVQDVNKHPTPSSIYKLTSA